MTALQQGSPEWLQSRKHFIGASEASIILGISPYRTAYQLWQEKLGLLEPVEQNFAMARGSALEEPARQQFELMTGLIAPPAMSYHPEYDFIRASLDGITFCGKYIVEIKCVNKIDHEIAMNGKIPKHYFSQVQHQLACCPSAEMAYYFSYDQKNPFASAIVEVARDNDYINNMIKEELKFWNCVKTQNAPEMTNRDFINITNEDNYSFSLEFKDLSKEYKDISDQIKELESKQNDLKDKLVFLSAGKSVCGYGLKVCHYFRPGNIEYKNIPELKDIDLEKYRKKSSKCCRISCEKI